MGGGTKTRVLTCPYCKEEFLQPHQTTRAFCGVREECITAGLMDKIKSLTVQDGDHEVWTGMVTTGYNIPRIDLHLPGSRRVSRRVVDFLTEQRDGKVYRNLQRLCEREGCINLDHYMVGIAPPHSLSIKAHLPLEPLLSIIESRPDLALKLNSVLRNGKRRGYFTVTQVDQLCCDWLDCNPSLIYGDLFFTAGTEEEAA